MYIPDEMISDVMDCEYKDCENYLDNICFCLYNDTDWTVSDEENDNKFYSSDLAIKYMVRYIRAIEEIKKLRSELASK